MKLQPETLESITRQVYKRFPEMEGSKPALQTRQAPPSRAGAGNDEFLVIYQKTVRNERGGTIRRLVRVVVNQAGKILRMSTSR